MAFSFAEAKANARRAVHATFGVRALFKDTPTSTPVELSARWHSRLVLEGVIDGAGAQVIEGVDRVVFDREELAAKGVAPKYGDIVTFPDYGNFEVQLAERQPYDGPVSEIWGVVR
jgi:hypothetical protein